MVACGAALVVATVASAGTIGVAAGVAAAGLGVSSATAATISTVAVTGTYCAAGTMGAITLSNAGEIITDGHNVIRDDMFTPVFGQEKASEIYQNTELLATLASMGITEFAARNPQFRPLPSSEEANAEESLQAPGSNLRPMSEEELEKISGGAKDPNWKPGSGGSKPAACDAEGLAMKVEPIFAERAVELEEEIASNPLYSRVEYKGTTKVGGEVRDISRRVYQRNDIDWSLKDSSGFTNIQRASKGVAPISEDGYAIELHHLTQREPGAMVELPRSMHRGKGRYSVIHGLVEDGNSFRNNPILDSQYCKFQKAYWKWRIKNLNLGD